MSTKRKLTSKLAAPTIKQSAKGPAKQALDDSKAMVSGGGQADVEIPDVVEILSDSDSDKEDDEDDAENDAERQIQSSTADTDDIEMGDADEEADITKEPAEPSFGDLVLANTNGPIDVASAFPSSAPLTLPVSSAAALPNSASLSTVLTQALKTNDPTLLETCLLTTDLLTIRSTIQRLSSPLASLLLSKLATRLHNRPGRAGSLMVWIQWTLVTHGGYLATQKDLIKQLAELNRVLEERARGLTPLLQLKGKLDMLEAQMVLRRNLQGSSRREEDDDDEEGVVYVEGEEEDSDVEQPARTSSKANGRLASMSEESEDMPNGLAGLSDEDEDAEEEDSSDEDDELIDDEAEETDADTGDDDSVDHDDQDSMSEDGDEESDDAAAAPVKVQKTKASGMFSRRA